MMAIPEPAVIQEPPVMTRTGFTFTGWFTDADLTNIWDFSDTVMDDMTLYAGWESVSRGPITPPSGPDGGGDGGGSGGGSSVSAPPVKEITVSFDPNGGAPAPGEQRSAMPFLPSRPAAMTKNDSVFTGWYADKNCTELWNFSTFVKEDMTLYAGWDDSADEPFSLHTAGLAALILLILAFIAGVIIRHLISQKKSEENT
jgi:uncharacterized repeat protein (TIGR02543 family)